MKKAIITALLFFTATVAHGQGPGCIPSQRTDTPYSISLIPPSQVPGVTATIWLTDVSGQTMVGHNATVGGGGNGWQLGMNWSTSHATSVSITEYMDGNVIATYNGLNNNGVSYPIFQGNHTYKLVITATDANGNSTIDRAIVTAVVGDTGVASSDGQASNIYLKVTSTLNGTPGFSWDSCSMLAMEGATHTPTATVQIGNKASGEMHQQVRVDGPTQAAMTGQAVNNLFVSATDYISVLPADLADSTNMQIEVDNWFLCSSAGQMWELPHINLVIEIAITASQITGAGIAVPGHPGLFAYPLTNFCQDGRDPHFPNSRPPDWNPSRLLTTDSPPGMPQYWLGYTSCAGLGVGGYVPFFECIAELMDNSTPSDVPAVVALIHGLSFPYSPSAATQGAGGVPCTNYNNKIFSRVSTTLPLPF